MAKDSEKLSSIDKQLDAFASAKEELGRIQAQADQARKDIREGTVRAVVVFIDMVGSTKFKIEHQDHPEEWILRVRQFDMFIARYVQTAGGRVVKYIGDEVMATFEGKDAVDNAMSLVSRVTSLQNQLTEL